MLYPKNIAEKLGFDQILELCAAHCSSERAKSLIPQIKFTANENLIQQRLKEVGELKQWLEESGAQLRFDIDLQIDKKKARSAGYFFEQEEFVQLIDALKSIKSVVQALGSKTKYQLLSELAGELLEPDELLNAFEQKLQPDGELKDNASAALEKLNAELQSKEKGMQKHSRRLFAEFKDAGFLAETELSIRNGRMVMPVLSEHKRKVEGLLLDQSNTGKVSYIEPLSMVQMNNELAELQIKRNQEIIKILRALTKLVVPQLNEIERSLHQMAVIDLVRAKAQMAIAMKGNEVKLSKVNHQLFEARHPLLYLKHLDDDHKVVPLDLKLNAEQRLVIISGPNAGGKSVALKTVGLLQLMMQSGFLLPLAAESELMIFEKLFIDIGDDQSIESDLSTYSSHLKTAKHIVNHCDPKSLVLMDEIGTGTDPTFGAPIAQAVVEEIHERGAFGVITTHFSNIKNTARALKHAVNAAMLFDTEKLEPKYKLLVGEAGSSFSFEVARNIGLNRKLIKRAKAMTDTRQYDLDQLLAEVQQQKDRLDKELLSLEQAKEEGESFKNAYQDLKGSLDKEKEAILSQARKEAEALISGANKEIEATIRQIKESGADKKKTQKQRAKLAAQRNELQVEQKVESPEFKLGDRVRIINTGAVGEIIGLGKKEAELSVNSLKTRTKLSNLELLQDKAPKAKATKPSKTKRLSIESVSYELDVRGMRTYDAIAEVDQWLDKAVVQGISKLRLIHGKGYGILRKELKKHLEGYEMVKSVKHESVQQGGDGVSIIELN